jgi:hypothetical protein
VNSGSMVRRRCMWGPRHTAFGRKDSRCGTHTAARGWFANISAARLDWNGGGTSQCQRNCRWQEQKLGRSASTTSTPTIWT